MVRPDVPEPHGLVLGARHKVVPVLVKVDGVDVKLVTPPNLQKTKSFLNNSIKEMKAES